jgi:hypothetical protein
MPNRERLMDMGTRPRAALAAIALLLAPIAAAAPVRAQAPAQADSLDALARDLDRLESLRTVKTLTRSHAQYAQFGLWNEIGALFAPSGVYIFDGQVKPAEIHKGPSAIATHLRARYGGGREGPAADGLSTVLAENPIVNLSVDGLTARGRWNVMIFHGHGGQARIEGGIFVADYAREGGVWKIATLHYYPQFDGPFDKGWLNWGGGDLPIVPYHYTTQSAGIPIPPPAGPAPAAVTTLAAVQQRIDRLNEEDRIRNLQAIYGYYADRKMWDDVADLFAANGAVDVAGQGIWRGKAGVRRWLASIGKPGLAHGQLNDRAQFDVLVSIAPGGNEAFARGIELGTLAEADAGKGWWEIALFHNRFVRENGVWKIREMRRYPIMKTSVFDGWHKSRFIDPAPAGTQAPDAPVPPADAIAPGLAMPAFLAAHPVTGATVAPAGDARLVASAPLTGAIAPATARAVTLAEARRRFMRSSAWDGVTNVSAAYGNYLDDGKPAGFAALIAEKGFKVTPFAGYYITRERVASARVSGPEPMIRAGIPYHWLMQEVLLIADDGRSVTGRVRLFHPNTGKADGKGLLRTGMQDGMYHNGYVLENGNWRIWDLSLDEPYYTSAAWQEGLWVGVKDLPPPDPNAPRRSFSGGNFPPDIPLTALGKRQEGFLGGTGTTVQWPSIQPMWFQYTNPVSGRVPPRHQTDCVPCLVRPDLRFDRNGFQQPPDAPAANRSP